jgi:hypothetical protein
MAFFVTTVTAAGVDSTLSGSGEKKKNGENVHGDFPPKL